MNYTVEQKMRVIRLYLDKGIIEYPPNATPYQKDNIRKRVKKWVGVYKEKGEEGLIPKTKSYSFLDRKHAVERILNGESKYQVAFSLGISDTDTLRKWVSRYRHFGWDGLRDGNAQKYFISKNSKLEKIKELELENDQLKKTIDDLNVEVEYLKKLIALVSQRM